MTNIKTMPKDTAAELLRYISEHEDFSSIEKIAGGDITVEEVRAVLRELSDEIGREAQAEYKASFDVKGSKTLTKSSKNIISCLSPREEKSLLTAFGLLEKPAARSAGK